MNEFESVMREILCLVNEWEPKLLALNNAESTQRQNSQNRTIKQIIGHLVDSASNNTHRIIHLQYQKSPYYYPDYANLGNNDRWILLQNYDDEEWVQLVQLWKYINLHIVHVIQNINFDSLHNEWVNALNEKIKLKDMVINYPVHLKAHLLEVMDLISI